FDRRGGRGEHRRLCAGDRRGARDDGGGARGCDPRGGGVQLFRGEAPAPRRGDGGLHRRPRSEARGAAMKLGEAGGARGRQGSELSEINVTPLVDVMLVLLIIFMVAAPMMTRGI